MLLACAAAGMGQAQEISAPEKLLFLTNHFSNVKQPTRLTYAYRQEAPAAEAFSDQVQLEVVKPNDDGTAAVTVRFLSGPHEIPIPPIDHAQGNPAILGFLERDIAEMKRLTGGATGYFRKRIRLALAAPGLPVKNVAVSYDGHEIPAQQITVQPYTDDPLKDRFGKFADKKYVFIVSATVPGSLYQISTSLGADDAAPVAASMTVERGDVPRPTLPKTASSKL